MAYRLGFRDGLSVMLITKNWHWKLWKNSLTTSERAKCTLLNYKLRQLLKRIFDFFHGSCNKMHAYILLYIYTHTRMYTYMRHMHRYTRTPQIYAATENERKRERDWTKNEEILPEIIFISLVSSYQFYRNHSFLSCRKEKCQKMHFTIIWLTATLVYLLCTQFSHQNSFHFGKTKWVEGLCEQVCERMWMSECVTAKARAIERGFSCNLLHL